MNLLMVGVLNAKGSYAIRGQQLGAALGARVTTTPTAADWRWADLVVLIKRAGALWANQAHKAKVPIVWDALDCWRQPAENHVTEGQAKMLLKRQIEQIRPVLTICATEAQAAACGGVYLPHHSWPGLSPTPARDVVTTVCYEGNPAYLGRWGQAVKQECTRRGWAFVLNPPDLREADLIVAFRDGPWDGWICREWKSGVKLVNALAAGRPFISQSMNAGRSIPHARSSIETVAELPDAFDVWHDQALRESVARSSQSWAFQYSVAVIAEQYQQLLESKVQPCAA